MSNSSVKDFIKANNPKLNSIIVEYLDSCDFNEATTSYVNEVLSKWKNISLEQKQIPYVRGEKEFWNAFWSLHILKDPQNLKKTDGECATETVIAHLKAELISALKILNNEIALDTELFCGRRPLP